MNKFLGFSSLLLKDLNVQEKVEGEAKTCRALDCWWVMGKCGVWALEAHRAGVLILVLGLALILVLGISCRSSYTDR